MDFNPDNPFDRVSGESRSANAALSDYYTMGTGRTLRALCEHYRKQLSIDPSSRPPTLRISTIFSWSQKYAWQIRVEKMAALDRALESEAKARALKEKMDLWVERQSLIRDRDYEQADQLRELVGSILAEGPKFIKTSRKVVKTAGHPDREVVTVALDGKLMVNALLAASKLQRLAAEMETEHTLEETTTPEDLEAIREKRWKSIQEQLENNLFPEITGDLIREEDFVENENPE